MNKMYSFPEGIIMSIWKKAVLFLLSKSLAQLITYFMDKQTDKSILKSYGINFCQIERKHKTKPAFLIVVFALCVVVVVTICILGEVM